LKTPRSPANTALRYGGAINYGGDTCFMTVIGCTISNNSVNSGGDSGGGITSAPNGGSIAQGLPLSLTAPSRENTSNNTNQAAAPLALNTAN